MDPMVWYMLGLVLVTGWFLVLNRKLSRAGRNTAPEEPERPVPQDDPNRILLTEAWRQEQHARNGHPRVEPAPVGAVVEGALQEGHLELEDIPAVLWRSAPRQGSWESAPAVLPQMLWNEPPGLGELSEADLRFEEAWNRFLEQPR